ncbi:MAG: hypothetical protein ABSD47_05495 [Candidatus Methylomirabilota bacterium]
MPPKKPELQDLTFKQIATANRGKQVELYGLTDDGKAFFLDEDKGYWVPLMMGTPKAKFQVREVRYSAD